MRKTYDLGFYRVVIRTYLSRQKAAANSRETGVSGNVMYRWKHTMVTTEDETVDIDPRQESEEYPLSDLRQLAGVSRSAYYGRSKTRAETEERKMLVRAGVKDKFYFH